MLPNGGSDLYQTEILALVQVDISVHHHLHEELYSPMIAAVGLFGLHDQILTIFISNMMPMVFAALFSLV